MDHSNPIRHWISLWSSQGMDPIGTFKVAVGEHTIAIKSCVCHNTLSGKPFLNCIDLEKQTIVCLSFH